MKYVGATRRIDNLGRVVIPNEYRQRLHIKPGELLEMFLKEDKIVITKYDVIGKNDDFLKIYLDLLNKFYGVSIVVSNLDSIIYQTNDVSFETLKEVLDIKTSKVVDINPRGDLIGYLILLSHENLSEKGIELITLLVNRMFE